jgi:hypothetical protein
VARPVVAFVGSFVVAIVVWALAVYWYGSRRAVGAPLTSGEAMAAAAFVFALMLWSYGVVPHQWLQYANNELQWTPSKILLHSGQWKFLGMPVPPFEINYEKLSHTIVVVVYAVFLGLHVAGWALWQDRPKRDSARKAREIQPSTYGRPLVKQG